MGNYENIVKIEEIRRRTEEGDFQSAQKILDTLDHKKIKNSVDMGLLAEVFTQNERYNEAMNMLLKIYQKAKTRKIVYQLVEISIKKNNVADAEMYLLDYKKIAPQDFYNDVFRYKIDKLKGVPVTDLIETLESLKKTEYIEQWAYELAKLYYKAGMEEECINECTDIVLWFGDGVYVEKAKLLKVYFSGEADKDKLMEELKRRATEDKEAGQLELSQEREEEYLEDDADQGDFASSIEINENKSEDEISEEEIYEDEVSEEEIYENEVSEDFTEDLIKDLEASEEVVSNYDGYDRNEEVETTENELAERDVEVTLYQMLQEEDMDEEDKKIKEMSKELELRMEEIFGNFLHVKSIKKQLIKSLEEILRERTKSIQMIITGTENSGKTTLAKDLIIFFNKIGELKSKKIAKISADKMNSVDILSKKRTLRNCCLIIENASELNRNTIDKLLELIQYFHGDIIVIFEENKKNINKLFRECPKLMDLFKNRIHLPQYTPEDLLGFAHACLKQQDYQLSMKANSILHSKIYQIARLSETKDQLEEIQELMKALMSATDVRIGKQLPNLAQKGRLKEVDIMYILPEDFNPIP